MIPLEVFTMLGSYVLGFIKAIWQNNMDNKQKNTEMMIQGLVAREKTIQHARKLDTPHSNKTRRFIVIGLGAMAFTLLIGGMIVPTNILVETPVQNFLGLFSWGGETKSLLVNGIVAYPWLSHAILSVTAFYFGQKR